MTSRRPTLARLSTSLAIAVGLVLVFLGLNASVTGKQAQGLPAEIESIQPVRNATQVQQQEQVQADLIEGYTGALILNGIELETVSLADLANDSEPGASVSLPKVTIFEPGNGTLTFTPTGGAPVENFLAGINTVKVVYWKLTEGRGYSKSFTWQFDVI